MKRSRVRLVRALFVLASGLSAFSASLPPEVEPLLAQCFKAGEWGDTPPAAIATLQNLVDRNDEEMRNLFKKKAIELGGGAEAGETFMKRVASAIDKNGLDIAEAMALQAVKNAGGGVDAVIRTGSSGNRHMNLKDPANHPTEGVYTILSSDDDISFLGPNGKAASEEFNKLKKAGLKNARCKGFAMSPISDATSFDLLVKQIKDPDAFVGAAGFGKIKQEMIEKGGAVILQNEGDVLTSVAIPVKEFIEKNAGSSLAEILDVAKITADLKTFGPMTVYASCARQLSKQPLDREKVKYLLRIYAAMEAAGSFQEAATLGLQGQLPDDLKKTGIRLAEAYAADKEGKAAAKLLAALGESNLEKKAFKAVLLSTCSKLQKVVQAAENEAGHDAARVLQNPDVRRMINELGAGFALIDMTTYDTVCHELLPKMRTSLRKSGADNLLLLYKILFDSAVVGNDMSAEAMKKGLTQGVKLWTQAGSPQGVVEGMKEAGEAGKQTRLLLAEASGERLIGTKAGEGANQFKKILDEGNGDTFLWKMLSTEMGTKFAAEAICNAPFVMYTMYTEWQKGEMKDLSDAAFIVIDFVPMGMGVKRVGCEGMTAGTVLLFAKDALYFTPAWPLVLVGDVLKMSWDIGGAVQLQSESEGLVDVLTYNGDFEKNGDAYRMKGLDLPQGGQIPRDDIHHWLTETKSVLVRHSEPGREYWIDNLSARSLNVFNSYYLANDPALAQMRAAAQSHLDAINWSEASRYFWEGKGAGGYLVWMGGFEFIVNQNKDKKWAKLYENLQHQVEARKEVVLKDWMTPQLIELAEKKYATLKAAADLTPQLVELQKKMESLRGSPLGVNLAEKVAEQAKALSDALDNTYEKIIIRGDRDTVEKKLVRGAYWPKAFKAYQSIYDKNVNIPATIKTRTGYDQATMLQFEWTGEFEGDTAKSEQSRAGFARELSHITGDISKIKGSPPAPGNSVDQQAFDLLGGVVFPWQAAFDKTGSTDTGAGSKYFTEYAAALEKVRALYGQNKDFNELLTKGAQLLVTPARMTMEGSTAVELKFVDKTLAEEYAQGGLKVTWSCAPSGRFYSPESELKTRFTTSRPEPALLTATVDRTGSLNGRGQISRLVEVAVPDSFLTLKVTPPTLTPGSEFTISADVPPRFTGKDAVGFHYRWSTDAGTVDNKDSKTVKGKTPAKGAGSVQLELWVDGVDGRPYVLARRKVSLTVETGAPAFTLLVKGPEKAPVKSAASVTATLKAQDPKAAKMAAEVIIEWLEGDKVLATGPGWTPDTSKARDYRLTVQGVIGQGKTKQILATARYELVVTDGNRPGAAEARDIQVPDEDKKNKVPDEDKTNKVPADPEPPTVKAETETAVPPELIAAAYRDGRAVAADFKDQMAKWGKSGMAWYGKGRQPLPHYARQELLVRAYHRGYDDEWLGKPKVPPTQAQLKAPVKPLESNEYLSANLSTGADAVQKWINTAYVDGSFLGSLAGQLNDSTKQRSSPYAPNPWGYYLLDAMLKAAFIRGYDDGYYGRPGKPPTEQELGGAAAGRVQVNVIPTLTQLKLGESVQLEAVVNNALPQERPLMYEWTGGVSGNGASVGFTATKPGNVTLAVTVTGAKGLVGKASVTFEVGGLEAALTDLPTGPVVIGTPVKLAALVTSGGQPAKGRYVLRWQPHPEAQFVPFESEKRKDTVATFQKTGRVLVWVEVLAREGAVLTTQAESAQVAIDVVAPKLNLTAQPAMPYVGQTVTLVMKEDPAVPDALIGFWWDLRGETLNAGALKNERQYSFIPKNTRPVTVTAHGKGRKDGEDLGEATITVAAQTYTVQVSAPKRQGLPPRIWKDGVGLVEAPEEAIGTFQDVTVSASISPTPPGQPLSYQWRVEPEGCSLISPYSQTTRANASQKGTYRVTVQITDKNGLVLGSGSGSISVTVSQDDQKEGAKPQQAAKKTNADTWLAKGYQFEKAQQWDQAIACYESAQQESPNPKVVDRIRYVKAQKPAPAPAARSLTGVFKASFREEGKTLVLTMTLKQTGARVTGRINVTLPDADPRANTPSMSDPINATIQGNRLVPDGESEGSGGVKVISPDYNSLTLDTPIGPVVFKRIN